MLNEHYNKRILPFMEVIDNDNGAGYSVNISQRGIFIVTPSKQTKMFYEVKTLQGKQVVFIKYIHYANYNELLNLLAFAVQWWSNLRPAIVYMKEKKRDTAVGKYLVKLGFKRNEIKNTLELFDCNNDGYYCSCPVYEYFAYNVR